MSPDIGLHVRICLKDENKLAQEVGYVTGLFQSAPAFENTNCHPSLFYRFSQHNCSPSTSFPTAPSISGGAWGGISLLHLPAVTRFPHTPGGQHLTVSAGCGQGCHVQLCRVCTAQHDTKVPAVGPYSAPGALFPGCPSGKSSRC